METNRINLKTLCLCLLAILLTEAAIGYLIPENPSGEILLIGVVRALQTVLIFYIIGRSGQGLERIGLLPAGMFSGFKKGLAWSAGFGGLVVISFALLYSIGIPPLKLITVSLPDNVMYILLLFCIGGVVGPVAEEVFFRGVLYGYLRRWGILVAIFLSTLIFVLVHSITTVVPFPQIIGGVVFALSYEIEKNLIAPITIHVAGNLAIFTLSLLQAISN